MSWTSLRMYPVLVGVVLPILSPAGCPFTASAPTPNPLADRATSVVMVAAPARRLLVTGDENQSRSRLLALWIRIENNGSETFAFDPTKVTLTFADGTVSDTLDRGRATALIERLDVAPTDEAAAEYPEEWTLARRSSLQPTLKRQLGDGLLTERALGKEAVEGYILFDTKQRATTLDDAWLKLTLVRDSDGASFLQFFHFTTATANYKELERCTLS